MVFDNYARAMREIAYPALHYLGYINTQIIMALLRYQSGMREGGSYM